MHYRTIRAIHSYTTGSAPISISAMAGGHCYLLDMPQEVRDMIYAYALRSEAENGAVLPAHDRVGEQRDRILQGIGILSTCKQIHDEAHLALTKVNVFSISFHLRHMNSPRIPRRYHAAFKLFRSFRVFVQICHYEVEASVGRSRTNVKRFCASLASFFGRIHARKYRQGGPQIDVEMIFDGDDRFFRTTDLKKPDMTVFTYGQRFLRGDKSRFQHRLTRCRLYFIWAQLEALLPKVQLDFAEKAPLVTLWLHPGIDNFPIGVELHRKNDHEVAWVDHERGEMGVLKLNAHWRRYVYMSSEIRVCRRDYM